LLGMALSDVDERQQTITVRLKGARQDHRVSSAESLRVRSPRDSWKSHELAMRCAERRICRPMSLPRSKGRRSASPSTSPARRASPPVFRRPRAGGRMSPT
jgi:hypothetical protein